MGDVVHLEKQPQTYWCCGCDCFSFYLRSDEVLECANCGSTEFISYQLENLPDTKPDIRKPNSNNTRVVEMHGHDATFNRFLSNIKKDETAVIFVLENNGTVRTFDHMESLKKVEWCRRLIDNALAPIEKGLK